MFQCTLGKKGKSILAALAAFILTACLAPVAAASDEGRLSELKRGAEKEGRLVFYSSFSYREAVLFIQKFQKRYPFIKVDLNRLENTQIMTRVLAEQRAKKYLADVVLVKGTTIHLMQKHGVLARYHSPEREFFADGFKDKDGYWTDVYPTVLCVVYNTRQVAPKDVPTTWQDLLKPQWKGKIAFNSISYTWPEVLTQIMGKEAAIAYMKALARQNPVNRPGSSLSIILTGAGEFAMGLPVNANIVDAEKAKGARVDRAMIKPYYGDLHPIALTAHAPHPNAGKLFIDYILSQEGQELIVELGKSPARKGLTSKIANAEEMNTIDPALGENLGYYQKLIHEIFLKR